MKNFLLISLLLTTNHLICSMGWAYLKSEPFKIRYVIAAYYLNNCTEIIEIGGYKTPISDFLENKKITVIDPLVEPRRSDFVYHYTGELKEWMYDYNNYIPENNYGLLMLGFYLENMDDESWRYLYKMVNNSVITIIECPIDWQQSLEQLDQVLSATNKKIFMQIVLDLSGNDFGDLTDSWPPRTKRALYFIR